MSDSGVQLNFGQVTTGTRLRVLSAAILIPISLLCIALGGFALALLAGLLGAAMSWELSRHIARRRAVLLGAFMAAITIVMVALALGGRPVMAAAALGAGSCIAVLLVSWLGPPRHALLAGGALAYIGAAAFSLIALRGHGASPAWLIAWLFLLVWSADTAAFLVGTRIGRHLLCPAISPDKSWEGLAAAMGGGAAVGLCLASRLPEFGLVGAAILSAGLAVVAQIGDLIESALKRRLGVKDMSALIPGHGGVLDRLDSLLLVLIIAGIGERVWSF